MKAETRTALERAQKDHPELGRSIALQLDLLGESAPAAAPAGFAAAAAARLAAGSPAIDPATLVLDWAAVARRMVEVGRIAGRHDPIFAESAAGLEELATEEGLPALARQFLTGEIEGGTLAGFVLTHALRPFLRPLAEVVAGTTEGKAWRAASCPTCGGRPDFAALEGEGGSRRLLCSRCDSEWAYARTGCPYCASEDPKTLAYFQTGEGKHRLYVCDGCRGYLKTIDLRETWGGASLAAERILAVGLDLAAVKAGYGGRPSLRVVS